MMLFEVTNGWLGFGYCKCLVIASNAGRAVELARPAYEREAKKRNYESSYYTKLQAELLCKDTTNEWAGEVSDE